MTHHPNRTDVERATGQKTFLLHGIEQSGHVQRPTAQLLRSRRRTVPGQHPLLLAVIAAGMLRQQHGVAVFSQDLAPALERLRLIPETVGDHHQAPVGVFRNKADQPERFRPMRHGKLKHVAPPATGQR